MKNKVLLVLIVSLFLFDCSSDSDNPADDNPEANDGTLIKQIIETYDDGSAYTINFEYDGNMLTSLSDDDGYRINYEYSNDQLIKYEIYDDNELIEFVTLEYNNDGSLSNYKTFFVNFEPGLDGNGYRHELTYNADNTITEQVYTGDYDSQTNLNYTLTKVYIDGNIESISADAYNDVDIFEYDNMNSIYQNISSIDALILADQVETGYDFRGGTNNVTRIVVQQGNNFLDEETLQYQYNDDGYPVSAVYQYYFFDELDDETNIEFIYN